jgi:integrase
MPLTDAQCRNAACPPDKVRTRLADAGGLYLEVTPNESRRWFWKYRFAGSEKRLALGAYPATTIRQARLARDAARLQLKSGTDPVQQRKLGKLVVQTSNDNTVAAVANEWFGHMAPKWSEPHRIRERRNLDKDLLPRLGARPINEVKPLELKAALLAVEARGSLDVAGRVLTTARGVWDHAVSDGKAERNIARDLNARIVLKGRRTVNRPTLLEPAAVGQLLRAINGYRGPIVGAALWLAPRLFQRPSELRCAEWSEFDLDAGMWSIPSQRMKRTVKEKEDGGPHDVPLAGQVVAKLRELHMLTGGGTFLFPSLRGGNKKPISDATLLAGLAAVGYTSKVQTVHGFRATARTMLVERLNADERHVEAQLAHAVKDANGNAYNRTTFLSERTAMMQGWAVYLDQLQTTTEA